MGDPKICTRGVWDDSIPGIRFDENGVSNYANLFDNLVEAYPRGKQGIEQWNSILKKIKQNKNNKYDCVIGLSGGTDSSYLLYLAKENGLNPLAVNLDNGWNSDIAVKNIQKITKVLNIDLVTYVIEYEEIKDLLRSYMKASLPWIDIPTDLAIKAVLYKVASKERIKFILRGNDFRSEGTQPREWTYGDGKQLKYIHKKFGSVKLKTYPNYSLFSLVYYSLLKGIKSIYPYYYLEYNKQDAQKFLEKNFNWQYYGGHHFENIFTKFAISYWLFEKFGIDKRKISLSAQILSGKISRDKALEILETNPYDRLSIKRDIEYLNKKLDISTEEFDHYLEAEHTSFEDYPSYYSLIQKTSRLKGKLLKRIFIHKPMSLFQSEMRESD